MVRYYQAWFQGPGATRKAAAVLCGGARYAARLRFPNQIEAVLALQAAIAFDPDDPRAPYYLGNFWYAHRQYDDAIAAWERAAARDPDFPTVHRNLGMAAMNKRHQPDAALALYERAFALDPADARVFFELDQLHKKMGAAPPRACPPGRAPRSGRPARRPTLERVTPSTCWAVGGCWRSPPRIFHPGRVARAGHRAVRQSLVQIAREQLAAGQVEPPLSRWRARVPHNGRALAGAQENHLLLPGLGHERLGCSEEAQILPRAAVGLSEPTSPLYYNDQPPDMIFYQGLAREKLGQPDEARAVFEKLLAYGRDHLDDEVQMDYFAVSLPDFLVFDEDLTRRNRIHCHYMMALGHLGLRELDAAAREFAAVLALDPAHVGATLHRSLAAVRRRARRDPTPCDVLARPARLGARKRRPARGDRAGHGRLPLARPQAAAHEWLLGPADCPFRPVPYGASFVDQDMSGWDEMFPHRGVSIPRRGAVCGRRAARSRRGLGAALGRDGRGGRSPHAV